MLQTCAVPASKRMQQSKVLWLAAYKALCVVSFVDGGWAQ
jgi:hypothetical protein